MQVEDFIEIRMPVAYTDHFLCLQLQNLLSIPDIEDGTIEFERGQVLKYSTICLGLLSPFFANVFLTFRGMEKETKHLALLHEDAAVFRLLVDMASGRSIAPTLPQHVAMVKLSHFLQMEAVHQEVESSLRRRVTKENCCEMLLLCRADTRLQNINQWALDNAVANFERVLLQHDEVWLLDESTLGALLGDDNLAVHSEDTVLHTILLWLQKKNQNGSLLFRELRTGVLSSPSLMRYLTPEQAHTASFCRQKNSIRKGFDLAWNVANSTRFIATEPDGLTCFCAGNSEYAIFCGTTQGTVVQLNVQNDQVINTLHLHMARPGEDNVSCVQMCDENLLCAHNNGVVRVWRVQEANTGTECKMRLLGHTGAVMSIAFTSSHYITVAMDHTIRAWDIQSGLCVHTETNLNIDTHTLLLTYADQYVIASIRNQILVYDVQQRFREIHTMTTRDPNCHWNRMVICNQWLYTLETPSYNPESQAWQGKEQLIHQWELGTWRSMLQKSVPELIGGSPLVVSGSELIGRSKNTSTIVFDTLTSQQTDHAVARFNHFSSFVTWPSGAVCGYRQNHGTFVTWWKQRCDLLN